MVRWSICGWEQGYWCLHSAPGVSIPLLVSLSLHLHGVPISLLMYPHLILVAPNLCPSVPILLLMLPFPFLACPFLLLMSLFWCPHSALPPSQLLVSHS